MNKKIFWFLIVIVLLGATLWLFRPKGELVIAVQSGLNEHHPEITRHVEHALANVRVLARHHALLSFTIPEETINNPTPSIRPEQALQFGDVVDVNLTSNIKLKIIEFDTKFKIDDILEKSYEELNYYDNYLIFSLYATGDGEKIQIIVSLYPLDPQRIRIPEAGMENADQVREQLAFYIYDQFRRKNETAEGYIPIVPMSELSHSISSLKATRIGFQELKRADDDPRCAHDCVRLALDIFNTALKHDKNNAHAHLGISLALLRQAMTAIKRLEVSGGRAIRLLATVGRHFRIAREESTYLRKLTDSENWDTLLRASYVGELQITPKFLETVRFWAEALDALHSGDFVQAQNLTSKVQDVPPVLRNLVSLFIIDTKLRIASTQDETIKLLDELDKLYTDDPNHWMYNIIYGMNACVRDINTEDAVRRLWRAINSAKLEISHYDGKAILAWCLGHLGRSDIARQLLKESSDFSERFGNYDELYALHFDMGLGYAELKMYDKAAEFLIRAVKSNEILLKNVRTSKLLSDFRENARDQYERVLGTRFPSE